MKVITENNFEEIINSSSVVLVDFWAEWCGPCRMLSPVVEDIAAQYEGKVTVAKCNVDDCQDVAMNCGIRSIPTLIYYKGGEAVDRTVGVVSASDIKSKLDQLL